MAFTPGTNTIALYTDDQWNRYTYAVKIVEVAPDGTVYAKEVASGQTMKCKVKEDNTLEIVQFTN